MLTGSGWAVAVATVLLLAGGVALGYPELLVLGLAGLVVLLVAGLWMAMGPNVRARREVRPLRVTEGETARGVLTVTNLNARRSPPFLAVERVGERGIRIPLPSLAGNGSATAAYPLPTERRGVFPVGPLGIGHTDPLRLMRLAGDHASTTVLRVHPTVYPVEPLPTGFSRDMDGPTTSSAPQGGVAFHSLREYVPGDDTRLIHAKSTARAGTLMVRHNVVPNEPRMMIVLDTAAASYGTGEVGAAAFDDAVRIAASLAVAAVDHGFPLDLRTTAGGGAQSERAFRRTELLDLLAGVEATGDDPGLSALPRMSPPDDGVSLGVITGHPAPAMRSFVSRVRSRFQLVALVHVGPRQGGFEPTRGALVLEVATGEEFAPAWDRLVRR